MTQTTQVAGNINGNRLQGTDLGLKKPWYSILMATINKKSIREEINRIKKDFEHLCEGGKVSPEIQAVMNSQKNSTYATTAVLYLDQTHDVCNKSMQVVIDWTEDASKKNILASALTAFASGKKVGFGLDDCPATGHPIVYRLDIAN